MIANLPPYASYKPSGVDWLGDVPAHWEQLPGRACYTEKKVLNVGMQESTVLSLSYGRIVVRPPEKLRGLVPESFETYQIVEPGDIVVRSTDLQNDWNSLRFGLCRRRGIITAAYMCLKANGAMLREYGHLLLHSYDLKKVFYGLGSGLRQNLSWDDFRYLPCLVPPLAEQNAIVCYLDHMDRRIQRYIEAKEKLITLLQETRQATIQRAVTRGLAPSVPRKPSGVEWLGDVPAHWEVRPNRVVFTEVNEQNHPEEQMLSVTITRGVILQQELLKDSSKRDSSRLDRSSYKLVQPGDIAYNKMRAWQGAFGVSDYRGIVSPAYIVQRPRTDYSFRFLHYLLRTPMFAKEAERWSYGIASDMWSLRPQHFKMIYIPLPPLHEQRAIAAHVDKTTSGIDAAIDNARRQVEFMTEYRASLIAHVVTGKLDVRAAAAQLPQESRGLTVG